MYKCLDTKEVVGTYKEYLHTKHWKLLKSKIYKKYKYNCAYCKTNHDIDLHHKTYERVGNENIGDLVYLCRLCHKAVHDGLISDNKLKLQLKAKNKRSKKKKKKVKHSQKNVKSYTMTKNELETYKSTGELPEH